jgi:hypothetical protein
MRERPHRATPSITELQRLQLRLAGLHSRNHGRQPPHQPLPTRWVRQSTSLRQPATHRRTDPPGVLHQCLAVGCLRCVGRASLSFHAEHRLLRKTSPSGVFAGVASVRMPWAARLLSVCQRSKASTSAKGATVSMAASSPALYPGAVTIYWPASRAPRSAASLLLVGHRAGPDQPRRGLLSLNPPASLAFHESFARRSQRQ